ncbi:MAG: hypothetical protein WBM90_10770 [Acidimicrobiia bacterium]
MKAVAGLLVLALIVTGMAYFVAADAFTAEFPAFAFVTVGLGALAFAVVGFVLTQRLPLLPMGWLCLGAGASGGLALWLLASTTPETNALGNGLALTMVTVGVAIVATFPSGHLNGRSWRLAGWLLWLVGAIWVVEPIIKRLGPVPDGLWEISTLILLVIGVLGVVRLVVLYVKGAGVIRQQLKWLVLALLVGGFLLVFSLTGLGLSWRTNDVGGIVLVVGGPIAIGLAALKYRLYDVDRFVSRTVSYAIVIGFFGLVFAAGVVWIPTLLNLEDSPLLVATTTLLVAAMFTPVRRRVQDWVDRRFNRSKYDVQQVMDEFAGSLKDQVDLGGVVDGWVGVVLKTMEPARVGVWVKEDPR